MVSFTIEFIITTTASFIPSFSLLHEVEEGLLLSQGSDQRANDRSEGRQFGFGSAADQCEISLESLLIRSNSKFVVRVI